MFHVSDKDKLRVSILLNLILSLILIFVVFKYMDQYNNTDSYINENIRLENKIDDINIEHAKELENKDCTINSLTKDMTNLRNECYKLADTSLYTITMNEGLLINIYDLEVANNNLKEELNQLSDKLSVYKKYDIYMYNVDRRTDCTYELLEYLKVLIEDDILNNIDFYCAFIQVQSGWIDNYTTTSDGFSGLGGFRNYKNEWLYEFLIENGKGSYSYDMILDPYLSLKLTKNYFYYLINLFEGDLYETLYVIKDCNLTESYIAKLDYYLAQYNTSVEEIAKETKARYNNTISN